MTIRSIVLFTILLSFAFLLGAVSLASNGVLLESFSQLENGEVQHEGQRMYVELSDELLGLAAVTRDYAAWLDTYEFMQGRNPGYLEQNYFDELFASLRFNLIVIADLDAKVVFAKEVHAGQSAELTDSTALATFTARYDLLMRHATIDSGVEGIAEFDAIPALVASRPILPDYGVGPVGGTLILARYLDGAELGRLAEKAEYTFLVTPADPTSLSESVLATHLKLVTAATLDMVNPLVHPLSDSQIATEMVADDVNGKPLLLLTSIAPRLTLAQGKVVADYLARLTGLVGLASAAGSLLIMEKVLIRPISKIISSAHLIAEREQPAERMKVSGSQDLRRLATSINEMLDALQRSQDKLAHSVAENRAILDSIPDIMLYIRPDGVVKWAVAPDDYPYRSTVDALVGQNVFELRKTLPVYSEGDEAKGLAVLLKAFEDGGHHIVNILSEDTGIPRDMEIRLSTLHTAEGGVLALVRDITERRNAEMAERNAVLLKEVHHRVKNNLQVVISLLNLQAAQAGSPSVAAMLRDSQDRVRSMALIHERLYNARDLSSIEFGEYVRELTTRLMSTHEMEAHDVHIDVITQPMTLDIDTALSCGLVVSELITNALKHAFRGRSKGKLTVRLECNTDSVHAITVADDGIGLPEQFEVSGAETLGLQLVTSLVRQIAGVLTVSRNEGTSFRIEFKPPAQHDRSNAHGG